MRWLTWLTSAGWLLAVTTTSFGQSQVTLTVDARKPGRAVPADFAGLSIFTGTQAANHRGVAGNLFSGTNTELITLFKNAGIHHLRLGATGSSATGGENLPQADIDALFAFAKATGIKVIYSLHGHGAAVTAKYVWDNYRPFLDCFAFDNEPDKRAGNDKQDDSKAPAAKDYFSDWRSVATAVLAVVPEAKFAGPDAAGRTLSARFVKREKDLGCISLVTQHTYIGGNSRKKHVDQQRAIDEMLSNEWTTNQYPALYRTALQKIVDEGFPFRLTEINDYVHGATNASDAFVSSLWALDCLHWWAEHGAAGLNFQNTEWIPTDTFYIDAGGHYQMRGKACGIRTFDLGGHGSTKPIDVNNKNELNLTAYAVEDAASLCVTVVNKEHGSASRSATITILAEGFSPASAEVIFLTAPHNDPGATNGITLGGAPITNNAPWTGQWAALKLTEDGHCSVTVPATSAAVVKFAARR